MVTWVETFEPEITKLEVKIYLRNPYEKIPRVHYWENGGLGK